MLNVMMTALNWYSSHPSLSLRVHNPRESIGTTDCQAWQIQPDTPVSGSSGIFGYAVWLRGILAIACRFQTLV